MMTNEGEELEEHLADEAYISKETREYCYSRDKYKCRSCGEEEGLSLHHVIYRSQGGNHRPENLVLVCFECHMRIHRKELVPFYIKGTWIFKNTRGWRYNMLNRRR